MENFSQSNPIRYPDYHNCIASLACSLLQYYGINPPNSTLPQADALLQKKYKNIVLLLLDGMGMNILKKHLSKDSFFCRNVKTVYSSTFPPTTVAATAAADSGLFPNQSGWLGWTGYFDKIDKNIVYFFSKDDDTGEQLDYNVAHTYVPYESLLGKIKKSGVDTHYLAPFAEPFPQNYDAFCEEIRRLCHGKNRQYIYAYWDEPDASMHKNGIDGADIQKLLADIEKTTAQLAGRLQDTLLLITADHGHINVKNKVITDYPDITECLVRMPSMEMRALNFFIKDDRKEQFVSAFHRHFGDSFLLFSKKELMEKQLLGIGKNRAEVDPMLGDYLAAAIGDIAICNTPCRFKGNHAGLTADEMEIPLIALSL
ncbi:MAG: alkaline phosphatase family protein [Lachnospiraceae bacterium]